MITTHGWILIFVAINIALTLWVLTNQIVNDGFTVNRWYARLRRQGNPYLDFPVIRAPTTKFPDF